MQIRGRWALVTGAANGIGRATAFALAREGANLVLCDIDEPGLATVAAAIEAGEGARVLARRVDVSDRAAMAALAGEIHETVGPLGVLVNNAGVGVVGGMLDTTLADWDFVFGVNLWGVVHGCHYFVPRMVEAGQPAHVVVVASAAGFWASRTMTAYAGSKFAVLGIAEALHDELAATPVGVSTICPGIIDTEIVLRSRYAGTRGAEKRRRAAELFKRRNYGPDKVADGIVRAIREDIPLLPIAPEAWLLYLMKRYAPDVVQQAFKRLVQRLSP